MKRYARLLADVRNHDTPAQSGFAFGFPKRPCFNVFLTYGPMISRCETPLATLLNRRHG